MSTNSLDVAVHGLSSATGKVWLAISTSLSLVALLFLILPVYAVELTHTRLNPDPVGKVRDFRVSPDQSRVVYLSDQDIAGVYELYSVEVTGGSVIKLNEPLVIGRTVREYDINPDSTHVVYSADQEVDGRFDIYIVPINGGTPALLSKNLPIDTASTLSVSPSPISSDNQYVVYGLQEQTSFTTYALASVKINGGVPVTLTPPLISGGSILDIEISSDGNYVIYRADQDTDEMVEVYAVPITGGVPVKLNLALTPGANVIIRRSVPIVDNNRVLYRVADMNGNLNLYSVPITGGTSIRLNSLNENVSLIDFISPDGVTVLFSTFEGDLSSGTAKYRLYVSPVGGGEATLLSKTDDTDGSSSSIINYQLTSNKQTVFFHTIARDDGVKNYFYSVPVTGGPKTTLAGPLVGTNVYGMLTKDEKQLIITVADSTNPGSSGLLLNVELSTTNAITLATPKNSNSGIFSRLSQDGTHLIYHAQSGELVDGFYSLAGLFKIPITGGTPITISIPITPIDSVRDRFEGSIISNNQECAIYGVGQVANYEFSELYSSCVPSEVAVTPTATTTSTQTPTVTTTPTPTPTPVSTVAPTTATPTKPAVYLPVVRR